MPTTANTPASGAAAASSSRCTRNGPARPRRCSRAAPTARGGAGAADRCFERQWAETLLRTAFARVAAEWSAEGKGTLFATLAVFVRGGAEPPPGYDALAGRLSMPAATVRSHVNRLRARYRAALRTELRRTVGNEEEVDDELRELLRVLTAH